MEYYKTISDADSDGKKAVQKIEEVLIMTPEEKEEFDKLANHKSETLHSILELILLNKDKYPKLHEGLFEGGHSWMDNQVQLEFARAWENPSLIEVIESEHGFKVGDLVEGKLTHIKAIIISINDDYMCPLKVLYDTGISSWLKKEDVLFIKSNAINWEEI